MSRQEPQSGFDFSPGAADAGKAKTFYLGVSLTAFLVIFYETVAFQSLIFATNYMRAIQILAIALLGLAVGGLVAFFLKPKASFGLYSCIALGLPFSVLTAFASLCMFADKPFLLSLGHMLPFVCASMLISLSFSLAPGHRVYFYDLTGAAAGAVLACVCVPLFREEGSLILAIILGFAVAHLFAGRALGQLKKIVRGISLACILALSIVFSLNVALDFLNLVWMIQKPFDDQKISANWHGYYKKKTNVSRNLFSLKYSKGSLVERIDMVKVRPGRVRTYFNGYGNDHVSPTPVRGYRNDRRLPKGLVKNPDVLVIGPAAEGIVKAARGLGSGEVVGVEINPAIVDAMTGRFYEYSKKAYDEMDLHVIDARSFLKRTDRKFDIITMLNTHRLRNVGYMGQPEYLHTVESFTDLFDHLTPGGWLVLEERDVNDRARLGIQRLIANAKYVLESRFDSHDASMHFWVFDWYGGKSSRRKALYTQILIKRTPINQSDIAFIHKWQKKQLARWPKRKTPGVILRHMPGENTLHPTQKLLQAASPYDVLNPVRANMDPITDDQPFPYDVTKKRPHLITLMGPAVLLTILLGLLPVAILLIIHLFRERKKDRKDRAGIIFSGSAVIYFSLLGIGYLLLEVVLIQKLQMFLGMPVLAFAVVLGSMLFFSGLGSLHSRNWSHKIQKTAFLAIIALALLLFALLEGFINLFIGMPLFVRIVLVIGLLAPISYLMGTPFPYGIRIIRNRLGDRFGSIMFGLNGAFSALATPLALSLAILHGFSRVYLAGALVYAACFLLAIILVWRSRAQETAKQSVLEPTA